MKGYVAAGGWHGRKDADRETAREALHPDPEADRHIKRPPGHPRYGMPPAAPHPEADRHIKRPPWHPALAAWREASQEAARAAADSGAGRRGGNTYANGSGFREEDHPRNSDGKFATAGGGGAASSGADRRGALRAAAGPATDKGIAAMEHGDEEAQSNSEHMNALRKEVRGKILHHAPRTGNFLLGVLDGAAATSDAVKRMLREVTSGVIYGATYGGWGDKDSYKVAQAMVEGLRTLPRRAFTGKISDDFQRELNAALRQLDRADTPRETGKALAESVGVLSALFGPEFMMSRLASARSVLPDRRVVHFDGRSQRAILKKDIGMVTGQGIKQQGTPYELHRIKALQKEFPTLEKTPEGFPVYDAYDPATKTAYSMKTLDSETMAKISDPRQLRSTLKGYIHKMVYFEKGTKKEFSLERSDIAVRKLECGVPSSVTAEQWREMEKLRKYAEQYGIEVNFSFVR